ncbi:AraC family transcriptional regulator [Enterococcus sp. BWM-S5]|uniref:AraC family transcriptional regulator n=1 Tax=Enterococcus larvae TaxID=2794352 RepID=A0ABS4CKM0_9ENTE|nr:helix-turn-helix domain-containing protein [Enterococcus larvae]MBP1046827.1 AraC family transcriptional regulator [Enterococcus larvae]
MSWIEKLNQAIDYIEVNLDSEISYQEISRIVGCSIYNFQRIFSYVAGRPLSEYIRNRRLTMAAYEVMNTKCRLIDIAMKYGYVSQDSFARAFKNFHGIVPSKVRRHTVQLRSCPKLRFQIKINGEKYMNYKIEHWPAFKIMGYRYAIWEQESVQTISDVWENIWESGQIDQLMELIQNLEHRPAGLLGVTTDLSKGAFEYMVGVMKHVAVEPTDFLDVKEIEIPAATWAVFDGNEKIPGTTEHIYQRTYSEWLLGSGYQLNPLPVIECYLQDNRKEIWIAVKTGNTEMKE